MVKRRAGKWKVRYDSSLHSESTLQTFVTFSQKAQTENRKLSDFVCFVRSQDGFWNWQLCLWQFVLFLMNPQAWFSVICCEVIAKFKLLRFFSLIPFFKIDFLCDCYHSGIYSLIGVTNIHGERRLTITGIRDRYG